MDYLEEFIEVTKPYTRKNIIIGVIFFPIILPSFLIKRLYNKLHGSIKLNCLMTPEQFNDLDEAEQAETELVQHRSVCIWLFSSFIP